MRRGMIAAALVALLAGGLIVASRLPEDAPAEPAPGRPPSVELLLQNLVLRSGTENALRVAFEPADPAARVIATLDPATAGVLVCPLAGIADPLPPIGSCRDSSSGVRETVTGPRLGAIAIALHGTDRALADVRIEFAERGRDVSVRIPRFQRPPDAADCADAGCEFFAEIVPTRAGRFRASVRWSGPEAEALFLQGRVLARSFTATGIPYRVAARATGGSPLTLASHTSERDEYALVLRPRGSRPGSDGLTEVTIDASWA